MRNQNARHIVLGAGMGGLGAGLSSQLPVFEATSKPGGVCHSYYVDERGKRFDPAVEDVSECFRLEPAGGHWLFGVAEPSLKLLERYCALGKYSRKAAVFFPSTGRLVPYPLQENIRCLDRALRNRIVQEISAAPRRFESATLSFRDWLLAVFGPTLCELFFFPFNERYTAGVYTEIAPQDLYKSAPDRNKILRSAYEKTKDTGYNCVFYYPTGGLDQLVQAIGAACTIHFEHCVAQIDTVRRKVYFTNGTSIDYASIISTIPLNRILRLCEIECTQLPDPATAVLVVNIGAVKGGKCPRYHWVYLPSSKSGMHRVGFYSHVDRSFLPARYRAGNEIVTIYAEQSFPADMPPDPEVRAKAAQAVVDELKEWDFISEAIVVETTYTDPAYTWSWRGSSWAQDAIQKLSERGIRQIGRYGRWRFQGMIESFEEGRLAATAHALSPQK